MALVMPQTEKTVLIVEDNELNMKLFNDLLDAHGYRTLQTRDGMEALKKAEKDHKISEDEHRQKSDEVQKLTDRFVKLVDESLAHKEKEIKTV